MAQRYGQRLQAHLGRNSRQRPGQGRRLIELSDPDLGGDLHSRGGAQLDVVRERAQSLQKRLVQPLRIQREPDERMRIEQVTHGR
jgi:hypothetical protein